MGYYVSFESELYADKPLDEKQIEQLNKEYDQEDEYLNLDLVFDRETLKLRIDGEEKRGSFDDGIKLLRRLDRLTKDGIFFNGTVKVHGNIEDNDEKKEGIIYVCKNKCITPQQKIDWLIEQLANTKQQTKEEIVNWMLTNIN